MTVGRNYYKDQMENYKKIKDRTVKLKSQLDTAYKEFKIIYYSDPESFFYSIIRFNDRFFNGKSGSRQSIWMDTKYTNSEVYKDYGTDKWFSRKGVELPNCVFQGQEYYDEYTDEWNITRTIMGMYIDNFNLPKSKHSLNANFKNIFNLIDTYVGDDIIAYSVNGTDSHIHCLEKPKIRVDDAGRLHSTNSPAVSWKWTNLYCLHGVYFDIELFQEIVGRKLDGKEVISIPNIEQRRIAMDIYGIEKLMQSLDKKLINRSPRGNELYSINLGSTVNVKFLDDWYRDEPTKGLVLKYSCPSTGRIYFSGIPNSDEFGNEITRADQAMAWKFSLSEEEYSKLTIEA